MGHGIATGSEHTTPRIDADPLTGATYSLGGRLALAALALLGPVALVAVSVLTLTAALALAGLAVYTHQTIDGVRGIVSALVLAYATVPLAAFAVLLLFGLWSGSAAPDRTPVEPADAPLLFELIDEVRLALDAPEIHEVQMTAHANAWVVQHTPYGPFGPCRIYLTLGLPLFLGLPPAGIRAVIAHELAHLSRNHGWITRLIDHSEQTAERVRAILSGCQHWGLPIVDAFYNRYLPSLGRASSRFARFREFEADRRAAEVVGPAQAADTIIANHLLGRFTALEVFAEIDRRYENGEDIPMRPFDPLFAKLRQGLSAGQAMVWLQEAIDETAQASDTHPRLATRVTALGEIPTLPSLDPLPRAADAFFGIGFDTYVSAINAAFVSWNIEKWSRHQARLLAEREAFDTAGGAPANVAIGADHAFRRAHLIERYHGRKAALCWYQMVLAADPKHVGANFVVGRTLLGQGDSTGIEHLVQAGNADPWLLGTATDAILEFIERHNDAAERRRLRWRWLGKLRRWQEAIDERNTLGAVDALLPHGLGPDARDALARELARFPAVRAAYLFRKRTRHFTDKPLYVLVFAAAYPWYADVLLNPGTFVKATREKLAADVDFPGETIIREIWDLSSLGQMLAVRRAPDARIPIRRRRRSVPRWLAAFTPSPDRGPDPKAPPQ